MFLYKFDTIAILLLSFVAFLFVPANRRWILLLAVSVLLLWMEGPLTAAIPLAQSLFAYFAGPVLARRKQIGLFWLCLLVELAPWIYLKQEGAPPLGLSFYTFQILAYLIEVYWGDQAPEANFGYLGLYSMFFANKVAGPIEQPGLLEKFKEISLPSSERFYHSVLLIWLGMFQKFVLADRIADFVTVPLARPDDFSGLSLWLAVLLSKYQIFCDFSGASLVAVGLGGLFGLRLTQNFNRPFSARTLSDFWKRWHISLQTWIRSYVFYPLLSTPVARFGVFGPLAITFIVFGLWHDLRWTFVVYGILQACLLWLKPERLFAGLRSRAWVPLILLFNYVVLIALPSVLFRVATLSQAWAVWSHLSFNPSNLRYYFELGQHEMRLILGMIVAHELFLYAESRWDLFARLSRFNWVTRMGTALLLLGLLLVLASFSGTVEFIYSRF